MTGPSSHPNPKFSQRNRAGMQPPLAAQQRSPVPTIPATRAVSPQAETPPPLSAPPKQSIPANATSQPLSVTPLPLFQFFHQTAQSCDALDKLLLKCGELITARSECIGLWVSQKTDSEFAEVHSMLRSDDDTAWRLVEKHGRQLLTLASGSRQIQSAEVPRLPGKKLVMCPVVAGTNVEIIIGGIFGASTKDGLDCDVLMGIAAQCIATWISETKLRRLDVRARSLTDVVALTKEIDQAKDQQTVGLKVVNSLKRLCHAKQVAFVRCKSNEDQELLAISDVEQFDPHSEISKTTTNACTQSLRSEKIVIFPDESENASTSDALTLDRYCKTIGVDAAISVPMMNKDEEKVGAVLFATTPEQLKQNGYVEYIAQMLSMVTGHLDVVMRANRPVTETIWSNFNNFLKGKKAKLAAIAIGAFGLAMLIPMPYRIACDCELQPVVRRFIASPYDGVLSLSHVENGARVTKGQLVAELEGRQLRIEMAGMDAEYAGTKKKRDSALARGEVADAQIARSEMTKLESQMKLIRDKLENLEVRSPIDGIVVAGDLEKSEGAPVEMGQTLFEIGPLEEMLAEIHIPEEDIPYTKPGMPIKIKLNAYPFKTWHGEIEKIHARTEVLEGSTVFLADVKIENENFKLKPGMKGSAKISSNFKPLGWNLFHKAGEKLRYWTIW